MNAVKLSHSIPRLAIRVLLIVSFFCPLAAEDFGTPARAAPPKDDNAQLKNSVGPEGIPPLFVTHEGVTYNFTREKFGVWNAAAVKEGKILWQRKVLPHEQTKPGDPIDEIKLVQMRNGFNQIPKSGWYVGFTAYAVEGGVSLDKGETVGLMGHGYGIPDPAVPHALLLSPPGGKPPVFTVVHDKHEYKARSEGDMFGPWHITSTNEEKKIVWKRQLPRGIWISGMKSKDEEMIMNAEPFEVKTFTLLDIEGSRHLQILTDTGDVVGHKTFKKKDRLHDLELQSEEKEKKKELE